MTRTKSDAIGAKRPEKGESRQRRSQETCPGENTKEECVCPNDRCRTAAERREETRRGVKNKTLTWILAAVAVVVLAVGIYLIFRQPAAKAAGTVTMTVKDENEKTLKEKKVDFYEGDTVSGLVEKTFANVRYDNGMLMDIESLVTPSDWSYYICIWKDGKMSEVGIDQMTLDDGSVYDFVWTKNTWTP